MADDDDDDDVNVMELLMCALLVNSDFSVGKCVVIFGNLSVCSRVVKDADGEIVVFDVV